MEVLLLIGVVFMATHEKEPEHRITDTKKEQNVKLIHFSVDDATELFHDIYAYQYDSIFDNDVFGKLQYLHEQYDIKVTLYVYEGYFDFHMWDMPVTYKQEFKDNADWLKIGFHSATVENPEEAGEGFQEFTEAYENTVAAVWKFAGGDSLAKVLRLHYWYATEERVAYLSEQGIQGLLCSDTQGKSYDLTEAQLNRLYHSFQGVLKADMTYYVTDFRIENMEDVENELSRRKNDRMMVIFTHAWALEENYEKLETAVKWLYDNGYQFTVDMDK